MKHFSMGTGATLGWAQFFLYRATRCGVLKPDPSGSRKWGSEDSS